MARQPKPWYWAKRRAWYVTIDSVRHNLGTDKQAALRQFHRLMHRPRQRLVSSRSLVSIIDEFLDWVHKNRAPTNYKAYRYRLQRFAERWPNLTPEELRPFHVEKWVDSYQVSQTTRHNYFRAMKRCMRWAKKMGLIDSNPIADLEVPAAQPREVAITREEFAELQPYVRDESFRDLITVAWETGCRPQEILRVTAQHVDIANSRWVFKRSEAKTKKRARVVYLSEKALAITQRLMTNHPTGTLFRNSVGKPWTVMAVSCAFARLQTRMGTAKWLDAGGALDPNVVVQAIKTLTPTRKHKGKLINKSDAELLGEAKRKLRFREAARFAPKLSLYVLRHSWATLALQSGLDSITVATLMGHASAAVLANVYQHLCQRPDHLLAEARRVANELPFPKPKA